ncbi:MAG: aminomethyl-transferring glycine dehydrogenase subunit GcvPA [Pseudomonadota bacterium]
MRYLPHTPEDIQQMLAKVGCTSLDDLFKTIPETLREKSGLSLPGAMTEWELDSHMDRLAQATASTPTTKMFIGAGSYCHHIPAILPYLLGRAEFQTAYTPYQPEISQGTLQGIYEFQTLITGLLGMDIATASHYDGGTALTEALLIALRKKKKTKVAISSLAHPHHRQIIQTYLKPTGNELIEIPSLPDGRTDLGWLKDRDDIAGVAIQSPNFFGVIEDLKTAKAASEAINALLIVSFTEGMAYGLLKKPGSYGADMVAGEGQSFGIPQSFGGPGLGLLSGTKDFMRELPGRIVGKAKDNNGKDGFVLTLSTREQHIRREKASSNICSNNGLNAMAAAMYLATAGKSGLRKIAQINHDKAVFLKQCLESSGFKLAFSGPFFNEFVLKAPIAFKEKRGKLLEQSGIVAGLDLKAYYPDLDGHFLFCATEVNSRQDIETLAREVK